MAVVGRGNNTCFYVIENFTMCESTEQRICMKFCFKIGKTATETYQLLQQVYDEDSMGRTQVFDWFCPFKEIRISVESDTRSGRPSTSRNEEMFDSKFIVHHEYVSDGQKVNKECYLEVLRRLRECVRRKRPENGGMTTGSCTTTMRPHTIHTLCTSFWPNTASLSWVLTRSRTVCFFLFPRLMKVLKGHQFEATEDIKRNRRRHYYTSRKRSSQLVSNSGSNVGRSV